ncbi:MAG: CRISPR system precrRNA processing endoribonuclease RAMP protein Cas6 [Acidobacteria bacterium]|nr:CRISPR system precrRNA processing endoribonuclease RAMP protein Cas6 [Acidobacteriota bacterium]
MTTTLAALDRLELALLQFTLRAEEAITLPPFSGSTLRGAFGTQFRRIACAPHCTDASTCLLVTACAYARVFEAQPAAAGYQAAGPGELPRPFIIHPPALAAIKAGETFSFHLTLVGAARQHLPYFILTWRELGRTGLGQGRGRFRLEQVESHGGWTDSAPRLIYSAADELVRNEVQPLTAARLAARWQASEATRLKLDFVMPLRLKTGGAFLQTAPPFAVLLGALLRRLESLSFFYGGGSLALDYRALLEQARDIKTTASDVRWVAWERYSQRQDQRIPWGGLLGSVEYEGTWAAFAPVLALGELVGVGNNCTFGLGRIKLEV